MIKVYYTTYGTPLPYDVFLNYLNSFPSVIREKVLRYNMWQDAHASLLGKLLLRKGLEEFGINYALMEMRYTKYQRPYLGKLIDFNISHSGALVACVLSAESQVGIDLEEIKPISIIDFSNLFCESEWSKINADNSLFWFYYYWTAKEAVIKAEGRGLSIPLKDVFIRQNSAQIDQQLWHLKRLTILKNYIVHIASDKPISKDIEIVELFF